MSPATSAATEHDRDPAAPIDVPLMPTMGLAAKVFLAAMAVLCFVMLVVRGGSWSSRVIGLIGSGLMAYTLVLQARFKADRAARLRVDDDGVLLPPTPYRPATQVTPHADVKFAYVLGAGRDPILVVETRVGAFSYSAAHFADRGDVRRVARAVNIRARAKSA